MTIHWSDPFATPEQERSSIRRLRGRLPAPVTLWTAPGPAGLTISSTMVVDGEPGGVLGLVDDESDLWTAIERAGRFAVVPLAEPDRQLADRFAGVLPAPGGPFRVGGWRQTPYGPVPDDRDTWVGCALVGSRRCGWGLLVEGQVESVILGEVLGPLVHHRGRYRTLT